jgi:hypothetical protein
MPLASPEMLGQYWEPVANGPVAQIALVSGPNADPAILNGTPTNLPTTGTIAATTGTWASGAIVCDGFKSISVGATSNQSGGTITLQRYIDRAGLIPVGAPIVSGAFVAGTGQFVNVNDGVAFQSFKITIANTAASAATITGFEVLLNAN